MKRFLNKFELEIEYGLKLDWQAKRRTKACPKSDKIPFIKIGGIVKYDRGVIDKWLESHAVVSFD